MSTEREWLLATLHALRRDYERQAEPYFKRLAAIESLRTSPRLLLVDGTLVFDGEVRRESYVIPLTHEAAKGPSA